MIYAPEWSINDSLTKFEIASGYSTHQKANFSIIFIPKIDRYICLDYPAPIPSFDYLKKLTISVMKDIQR